MNKKIEKVREDIRLAEGRLREMQEHLKTLKIREKQLCDEEVLKAMRGMAGRDGDVIELLEKFQKSELTEVFDDYHENKSEKKNKDFKNEGDGTDEI